MNQRQTIELGPDLRVPGLGPGDVVEVKDNRIFINGEAQTFSDEGRYAYDNHTATQCITKEANLHTENLSGVVHSALTDDKRPGTVKTLANYGPREVPPGHVFVMGDNRDNSGDSRQDRSMGTGLGMIEQDLIKGKAHFVWMSLDSCNGFPPMPRVDRVGHSLYQTVEPNVGGDSE